MAGAQVSVSEFEGLKKKVETFEKIVRTRLFLSAPFPSKRSEPFEDRLQTNKIVAPQGLLQILNAISLQRVEVALVNGANQDVAIGVAGIVRVSGPTLAFSIGGFAGGVDGRVLVVVNVSGQAMTINNGDVGSTAGNRIATLRGGAAIVTNALVFEYSSPDNQWLVVGVN